MSISANHGAHCANWQAKNPNYGQVYYKTYKERFKQRDNNYAAVRYAIVNKAKSKPCMDCGNQYPPFVMDLDHRLSETKVACVSNLVRRHAKLEAIEQEIAKCDVVCSNCHRLRTWKRKAKQCL